MLAPAPVPPDSTLAPLALTIEGLNRAELQLLRLRHNLPAEPEVRVSPTGRVTLAFAGGAWLNSRAAVDLVAQALHLPRPVVSPDTGWYQTRDDAWLVYAERQTPGLALV